MPISGRTLFDAAKDSWKELKKALVFASDFMPDGKLPSGKTLEDLFLYVRKAMWAHYYAKNAKATINIDEADQAANASTTTPAAPTDEEVDGADVYIDIDEVVLPSQDWTFLGWACFVCFHPLTSNHNQLTIISMDNVMYDNRESKKKGGRSGIREEERKRALDVASASNGSPFKKNLKGGATRKDVTRIAVKDDENENCHNDRRFMAVQAVMMSKNSRADRLLTAMASASTETAKKLYSDMYIKLQNEINDLEKNLLERDKPRVRSEALDHFFSEMVPGVHLGASSAASDVSKMTSNA
jgi:hypothetical protein